MKRRELIVGIGSNVAEGRSMVSDAVDYLSGIFGGVECSGIYSTESVSGDGTNYFNAVARIYSTFGDDEVEAMFKAYELRCGRDEEMRRRKIVPIDLDIVVSGGSVLRPKDMAREYFQKGYRMLAAGNDQPLSRKDM